MNRLLLTSAAAVLMCVQIPAHADTLLVERAHMNMSMAHSMHGLGMGAVERRLGAPMRKLEPRGGQRPEWPVIERWEYPNYTVYFAHGHVVDVVLNKASPEEIGPAPVR